MPRGIQIINGTEYVYEYDSKWDGEKQYTSHNRNYIGKMVNGVFVPNKKYKLQQELEAATNRPRGPVPSVKSQRLFYGATYLLDSIGKQLGVTGDLRQCFPDLDEKILSIAYFLILEDPKPMSRFPKWARTHVHPYGKDIPSQRSSELFSQINEDAKQSFFRAQSNRRLETEYLAYDTTSISSYSKLIKQVRWGRNKEHDPLAQINLALVYGQDSRLPVLFRKLPGNITEVMTLQKTLADIDFLNFSKVKLVMDRGFYSEANVNTLYQKHYKFVMAVRIGLKLVQKYLKPVRESMLTRVNYSSRDGLYGYSQTIIWPYIENKSRSGQVVKSEKRLYLHLYYNARRTSDDQIAFNKMLDVLEEELLTNQLNAANESRYVRYYEVNKTPKRGIQLTPKQEAIDDAQKNYGYFALISNSIKDPWEALRVYRAKDIVEKAFDNLKERLNVRRELVSSEENLDGKLFVQFIALIYLARIDKVMRDNDLYKDYTIQELLDEMDVIECFEQPGKKTHIGEMTKKQLALYEAFGIDPPS
jgi:transposase